MKTRYIFIRHQDYFDSLNGSVGPDCVEFNLYETADPFDDFRNPFFHLDFYTLASMKNENVTEDYPEDIASLVKEAHRAFLTGKEEYMVDLLFYPSAAARFYGAVLPSGATLFDLIHKREKPCYAYIYLRESAPLTPNVLCCWLEKLSVPLFGDAASYALKMK